MPLYEFHCPACGKDFEDLVPTGTASLPCPDCGAPDTKRLMSACGFTVGGKTTTTASSSGCSSCSS